jgi:hypothetical protein
MILYPITRADLETRVEAVKSGWLARAQTRTATFRAAGDYTESSNIWSEIKDAFLDLQFDKCVYCERKLGGKAYNRKEYDIEHYRPKNAVKKWPGDAVKKARKLNYKFPLGDPTTRGYYLLPYNISNYTVSCTGCNSSLKSNYFPIAGPRIITSDDYTRLQNEEPYLLCPVGDLDADDPEDLITFEGFIPVPKRKRGKKYKRARITIDFFDLAMRDDLIRERSGVIVTLWLAHQTLNNPHSSNEDKDTAQLIIDVATSRKSPHTNCARAFDGLCKEDPAKAQAYKQMAEPHYRKLLETINR